MSDLKTATSAQPGSQIAATQLTTSEVSLYTCPAGVTFIGDIRLTNVSGTPTASISLVKSGGTASAANRIFSRAMTAGEDKVLEGVKLAPGDFISGIASAGTAVSVVVDGTAYSSATVGVASGIQDDAIGTFGRTASSGTVTSTCTIGTGSNRYLLGALVAPIASGGGVTYTSYDTLTLSCTDGAMTRLVSVDFNQAGNLNGSVHIYGRANPTSSSTQTLTANVVESGRVFNPALVSMSLSGVASVTGAATVGPSTASALSLAVSSASGHRPVFAAVFDSAPMDFDKRVRGFNGNASGTNCPHWMIFADALGAATVTATTSNSQLHAAVGIDLVPA